MRSLARRPKRKRYVENGDDAKENYDKKKF